MLKVVSVSLWGNSERYIQGAIKNAFLCQQYYPGWEYRVYAEKHLHERLKSIPGKVLDPIEKWKNGRFWRFKPAFEKNVSVMISRDCDSRIGKREANCVFEWLNSNKKFHIIRDHERHYDFPILAGMWGCINGISDIESTIEKYSGDYYAYLVDQIWLASELCKIYNNNGDYFIHGLKEKTLDKNIDFNFVGQGYDENDKPIYT